MTDHYEDLAKSMCEVAKPGHWPFLATAEQIADGWIPHDGSRQHPAFSDDQVLEVWSRSFGPALIQGDAAGCFNWLAKDGYAAEVAAYRLYSPVRP